MAGGRVKTSVDEFSSTFVDVSFGGNTHTLAPGMTVTAPVEGLRMSEHVPPKGESPVATALPSRDEFNAKLPRAGGETMLVEDATAGLVEREIGTDQAAERMAKGAPVNTAPTEGAAPQKVSAKETDHREHQSGQARQTANLVTTDRPPAGKR